jgi:hypothetical protein
MSSSTFCALDNIQYEREPHTMLNTRRLFTLKFYIGNEFLSVFNKLFDYLGVVSITFPSVKRLYLMKVS